MVAVIYGVVERYGRGKVYESKSGSRNVKQAIFIRGVGKAGKSWEPLVKDVEDVYREVWSTVGIKTPTKVEGVLAKKWGIRQSNYKGMINYGTNDPDIAGTMELFLPKAGKIIMMIVGGHIHKGWFEWKPNKQFRLFPTVGKLKGYFKIDEIVSNAYAELTSDYPPESSKWRNTKVMGELIKKSAVEFSWPDEDETKPRRSGMYYVRADGVDYAEFDTKAEAEKFQRDLASGTFARSIEAEIVKGD